MFGVIMSLERRRKNEQGIFSPLLEYCDMTTDVNPDGTKVLSPHEAFDVVGDETRLQILQTLGEADGPLAFSDLFDRVDYEDSGNFSYHLDILDGHFVRKTDEGYVLQRAGARIVEAILSGAVTDSPVVERTPVEKPCFLCGGQMEISYRQESVRVFCVDCDGTRGSASDTQGAVNEPIDDVVGGVGLPPAGVHNREPSELIHAGEIWSLAHGQASARGVCPRCSAPIDRSVNVCENHDTTSGRCGACDQRFGVTTTISCTNCIFGGEYVFTAYLLGNTDLMGFLIDHGIDPIQPNAFHLTEFDEEVLSIDPFEARFTFTADGESITLTVDEDLSVVDVIRARLSGTTRENGV